MATVSKIRRLTNPGRRRNKAKRKLSPLQKLFFGSKRQRASVKKNRGRKRRKVVVSNPPRRKSYRRRRRNVSSIITVRRANPTRRKRRYTKRRKSNRGKKVVIINKGVKMARRRKRSKVAVTRRRRARRNYGRRRAARRNPGYRRRRRSVAVSNPRRYSRRRRSNPGMRRKHYRRNPGMLTGTAGRVVGVLGGVAVTKLLMGFVPSTFTTGVMSYLAIGVVAVAQGKLIGKVAKNETLGNDFMVGGFAYLVAKVLNDFLPSIGSYTGISGMGLIGGSSFYNPQVNLNGNMGKFVVPAAVMGAIPMAAPASASLGRLRKTGRLM